MDTFVDPIGDKKPTEAQTIIDPPMEPAKAQTIIDLPIEAQNNSDPPIVVDPIEAQTILDLPIVVQTQLVNKVIKHIICLKKLSSLL